MGRTTAERLTAEASAICANRTVASIAIDEGDEIAIAFVGGGGVVFQTLGGIAVLDTSDEQPRRAGGTPGG